jgi:AraC-like DNA-binding protein
MAPIAGESWFSIISRTAAPAEGPVPAIDIVAKAEEENDQDLCDRIRVLVLRHAYRDCLRLVRTRLEGIYAHKEMAPRHEVLDLAEILTGLLDESGRKLTPLMARQVEDLESQRLDARSQYKVQELFCQITDALFDPGQENGGSAGQRIETVLHFIERNLSKGVTLEEAADFAHVSPCYLSRLFRKKMNRTFISYLKGQRIERAKTLLRNSDLPIANVSLDLSYADANYFCKAFKKEVGISPSQYRQQFSNHASDNSAGGYQPSYRDP